MIWVFPYQLQLYLEPTLLIFCPSCHYFFPQGQFTSKHTQIPTGGLTYMPRLELNLVSVLSVTKLLVVTCIKWWSITNMEQNISIRNSSLTYKMWQNLWGMSVFVSSDRPWMCWTMLKSLAWKTIGLVTSTPVDESNTDVMIFWTLKWDKNDVKLYII